jgi:hypothetical protein
VWEIRGLREEERLNILSSLVAAAAYPHVGIVLACL